MGRKHSGYPVGGEISDKLRDRFPADDPAWNPVRDQSEPKSTPLPAGVVGWSVTGRNEK